MSPWLDWINPSEFLPLLVLVALTLFVADKVIGPDGTTYNHARRFAAGVFLVYLILGCVEWPPAGATDLLMVIVRAALAAAVGFAAAALVHALSTRLIGDPIEAVLSWSRKRHEELARRARERQTERERLEGEKRRRAEAARLKPIQEQQRRQLAEAAARQERERHVRTDEARAEVIQFYDQHATVLADTLPPSLLKSNLQTRFPPSIMPAEAWAAARDMIAEMLPLIAAAREQARQRETADREAAERAAELERLARQAEDRRQAPSRLTEWYEREKAAIEGQLPDGPERAVILTELHNRYDQLVKEALQEIQP